MTTHTLDACTRVVDGEVIVFWNDHHISSNQETQIRSANRNRVRDLLDQDYPRIEQTFTVTNGKFRFHYRKEIHDYSSNEGEVHFRGDHLIAHEFSNRVSHTRVVI
jgi:hypothetical protein